MRNRIDVSIPFTHFKVVTGQLYRILANYRLRKATTVYNGRSCVMVDGARIDAAEIAWTLHYGIWPRYPIFFSDGNIFNVAIDNLLAVRQPLKRCRVSKKGMLHYHPLNKKGFPSAELAQDDWRKRYSQELIDDMTVVVGQQMDELERYRKELDASKPVKDVMSPNVSRRERTPTGRIKKPRPTSRPAKIPGMKWHWFESAWLSVPQPVHVSDDCRIRCHAVKHRGAVKFYYDPTQHRTFYWTQADLDNGKEERFRKQMAAAGYSDRHPEASQA